MLDRACTQSWLYARVDTSEVVTGAGDQSTTSLPGTDHVQCVLKIRWVGGFELHQFARRRVGKAEPHRMQPLAFQFQLGSKDWVGPIHRVTNAWMPDRCHVNPDLVRAAGFELDLE